MVVSTVTIIINYSKMKHYIYRAVQRNILVHLLKEQNAIYLNFSKDFYLILIFTYPWYVALILNNIGYLSNNIYHRRISYLGFIVIIIKKFNWNSISPFNLKFILIKYLKPPKYVFY